jgi:AcrR family transcriptional regulator
MGIKERRERERLEFREAILSAAREIAASEGWAAVSIRKIAERIEYSPPMIYEYFEDKQDLLFALMVDGFRQLQEQTHEVRLANPDPYTALLRMAEVYWDFSMQNPDLYQVMYGLEGVHIIDMDKANKPPEIQRTVEEIIEALEMWRQLVNLQPFDHMDAFHQIWGAMHGIVSLFLSRRAKLTHEQGRGLMTRTVEVILAGWSQGK